jgi:predicted nucleic acid-binding protein
MIVVDANLIGNLLLKTENSPLAIKVFEKDPDWYAPLLWQSEVRSILTSNFRYHQLPLEKAYQVMEEAHRLMLDHERYVSSIMVLELVGISNCTSYDCEYVALAREMNLTLVTFDKQAVKEFSQIAVFPIDFIQI